MNRSERMKALWADPVWRAKVTSRIGRKRVAQTRFAAIVHRDNIHLARPLDPNHAAVIDGHSIFKSRRIAKLGDHVLIPGENQRKIGHRITKGSWTKLPVYTLSLEERATCPRTCKVWNGCYGNAMPFAARWEHGHEFERCLTADLFWHAGRHPKGFAVRIHILGDFYSPDYLKLWHDALEAIPGLRVWGYTAHLKTSALGRIVEKMNADFPDRWVIRFSGSETIVINDKADSGDAIICPAETGDAKNCGSCGLCWAMNARDKKIAFLFHGNPWSGRKKANIPTTDAVNA